MSLEAVKLLKELNLLFPGAIPLLAALFGLLGRSRVFIPEEESLDRRISYLKENHLQKVVLKDYSELLRSALNTFAPDFNDDDVVGDFPKKNYKSLVFLFDLRKISSEAKEKYDGLLCSFILAVIFLLIAVFFSGLRDWVGVFAGLIILSQTFLFIRIRTIEQTIKKYEEEHL